VSDAGYAAAIAPEIDRIRVAIAHGIRDRFGPLIEAVQIPPSAGQMLGMLRNLGPDRVVTRAAVDALFVYQPPGTVKVALDDLAASELVHLTESGVGLTPRGVETIEQMYGITNDVVGQLWRDVALDFTRLHAITATAIEAATATGGLGFSVLAPVYTPGGTPVVTRFAESLTPLRFHRYDAHVAAWRAAGLTAEEASALADGERKDAIEAETNTRAAVPYAALSDDERAILLDGLRALPNVDP
jgi:hypothetical protein